MNTMMKVGMLASLVAVGAPTLEPAGFGNLVPHNYSKGRRKRRAKNKAARIARRIQRRNAA